LSVKSHQTAAPMYPVSMTHTPTML
jgi:hypothetical protein